MKEDPERYAEFLKKEKERSKRSRQRKEEDWETEHHTRAAIQKNEHSKELARMRQHRFLEKKRLAESSRQTMRNRKHVAFDASTGSQKKPKDMTPDEYKEHRRMLRRRSRSTEKRRTRGEKNTKAKRLKRHARQKANMSSAARPTTPNTRGLEDPIITPVTLNKTDYNFVSSVRQKIAQRAGTPSKFARIVKNLAVNTHSPRKKGALRQEGLCFSNCRRVLFQSKKIVKRKKNKRKPRKGGVSPENQQKIKLFFLREDISRALPHKRYACKEGPGYVMQHTLKSAYKLFTAEMPDFKIGYTKFTLLRPKHVRKVNSVSAETCQCVYCLNVRLKVHTLNRALTLKKQSDLKVEDEVALVNLLQCPKTGKFANKECIESSCNSCKNIGASLSKHYSSLLDNPTVSWISWKRVRKEKKVVREPVVSNGPVTDLLRELEEDLLHPAQNTTFMKHLFVAHWQHHQYQQVKERLNTDQILLLMDFAENKKSKTQDEIKSAYFDKEQIAFHPVIAYYRPTEENEVVRHALDFISDDIQHEHHAVHAFTSKTLNYLKEEKILKPTTEVIMFSDGCAAQYKGRGTFADLTQYPWKVQRVYFGSEHRKGEADAETGTVSKSLDTDVLCRKTIIRDAKDFYEWALENLTKNETLSKRTLFFVKSNDIIRNRAETDVQTLKGSRSLHQFIRISPFLLKARALACFCSGCRQGHVECDNRHYVSMFRIHELICNSDLDFDFEHDYCPSPPPPSTPTPPSAPPPPSALPPPFAPPPRKKFFLDCQSRLLQAEAAGFQAFVQCARDDRAEADRRHPMELPAEEPVFDRTNVDTMALEQCPPDVEEGRFPLRTAADGNCLPKALSFTIFGEDSDHLEIRIRLVWELAINMSFYLSPLEVCRGTDLDGCETLQFFHLSGDFPHLDLFSAYRKEVMESSHSSKELGPWHLAASAKLLRRKVVSSYPADRGSAAARSQLHRTFHPPNDVNRPVHILWVSNRTDIDHINPDLWTPNHFVPLVKPSAPFKKPSAPISPKIGDFVQITYSPGYSQITRKLTYCAMVIHALAEIELQEGEVQVMFLKETEGGYFVFPVRNEVYVCSPAEADIRVIDPPRIDNRGHHFFNL